MEIIFLKLGGSLITDKSKPYTAKPKVISQVFEEIKEVLIQNPNIHLVIGHGAGSFAHQSAKKYGTINGFIDAAGKLGSCKVHADATKLNQIIIEKALESKLPVYSLQPSAFLLTENKELVSMNYMIIGQVLYNGMIPLVYGDVIIDQKLGATIYSTDKLFSTLVKIFSGMKKDILTVKKVIHAGSYDGVLDKNQKVIPKINLNNFSNIKSSIGNSENTDVTGGMLDKVKESLELTKKGITSHIINGSVKGNISTALTSTKHIGTLIYS